MTPKDFFLHIGVIATLYVSAISLITLLFQVIETAYPDALNPYVDPYSAGIRWAIASLVIVFPLFLLLSWLLEKDYNRNPEKRTLAIRRWLNYLTLFVAGVVIATDLIVLINSFLGGEFTTRFILKVLVVLVVAGFVFGYYIWDLRRSIQEKSGRPKLFASIAGLIVIASIVGGFFIMGSPMTQRLLRFDQQKVSDLQTIQWQVVNYWQQKQSLPTSLDQLRDPISGFIPPIDPQSGLAYEYKPLSNLSFELCASFNLEGGANGRMSSIPQPLGAEQFNWQHESGRTCFERTIDPQLYPPVKR